MVTSITSITACESKAVLAVHQLQERQEEMDLCDLLLLQELVNLPGVMDVQLVIAQSLPKSKWRNILQELPNKVQLILSCRRS